MKFLIERGADPKLADSSGTQSRHVYIIIFLGQTCLHWAAASGDIDVVK